MERLPARLNLALPRISEQFNAAEVEHIQLTQSEERSVKGVPELICNRFLRFESNNSRESVRNCTELPRRKAENFDAMAE